MCHCLHRFLPEGHFCRKEREPEGSVVSPGIVGLPYGNIKPLSIFVGAAIGVS